MMYNPEKYKRENPDLAEDDDDGEADTKQEVKDAAKAIQTAILVI